MNGARALRWAGGAGAVAALLWFVKTNEHRLLADARREVAIERSLGNAPPE